MNASLKQLFETYPLPGWTAPEAYLDQVQSLGLNLVGLSSNRAGFPEVTASAAGLAMQGNDDMDEMTFTRAYFELIERIAILHAEQVTESSSLFPKPPRTASWKYSKSNGVAAHSSWKNACYSAQLELIERDAILRSWYFGRTPVLLKQPPNLSVLDETYRVEAFQFESAVPVVGIFGFPKKDNLPLSIGFGAHETLQEATDHAFREFLQRFGFTWDENLPKECPPLEPTPLFHLNYYLFPKNIELIQRWLRGDLPPLAPPPKPRKKREIEFIDLTPDSLQGKCAVVKAISEDYMPLVFGKGHPWLASQGPNLLPHPIS